MKINLSHPLILCALKRTDGSSMYHFIINPKSRTGNGLRVWQIVEKELVKQKIDYTFHFTHYELHAIKIAQTICLEPGIKNIVVLGGDGTVNEVINGIENYKEVLLGYIPSGSSNDLARSLHIPSDPVKALHVILSQKHFKYLDHGLVQLCSKNTQKKFAVSMGIGFDAEVCQEALDSNLKKILNVLGLGKLTYPLIAIQRLIKHHPVDARIITDGYQTYEFKNVFFIANMIQKCEGGGLMMAPDAFCDDHKLSICIIYDMPKIKAFLLLPSLFFGKHTLFHGVKILETGSVEIIMEDDLMVHTDGEYCGSFRHIKASCTKDQIRMIL